MALYFFELSVLLFINDSIKSAMEGKKKTLIIFNFFHIFISSDCTSSQFQCDDRCIHTDYVCDEIFDCEDQKDEQNCSKTKTVSCSSMAEQVFINADNLRDSLSIKFGIYSLRSGFQTPGRGFPLLYIQRV